MNIIKENKLVVFGAGKIGRSFIGQLFSKGGYEVVFVDMNKFIVDKLNEKHSYKIVIKAEDEETILIENVKGVYSEDEELVANEVASAGIAAISVGSQTIEKTIPMIAKGLLKRFEEFGETPLNIILAENMRDAADFFYGKIKHFLPYDYPIDQLLGLVETSIGKMVPVMRASDLLEDPLQVFAEPYNTLILDAKGFKNYIPDIEGLAPKQNIKAWVDRKLFIHNLGHVAVAYLGYMYDPDVIYLYEVLENKQIRKKVRETMQQAAEIVLAKYPGEFTRESLTEHIDDLLGRFTNRFLGDTIYRVGCDLPRKLGSHDRLSGAIKLAIELKLPYDKILHVLVCGAFFRANDENGGRLPQDIRFEKEFNEIIGLAFQQDIEAVTDRMLAFL
jgi:mannitol-1-phosphate 5-dehydrogenase